MGRFCVPLSDWPVADRQAWDAAHRRGGLLDDDGLAVDWASATRSIIAGGYGRYLSFLSGIGDLAASESPATRITRPRVEAYVEHLRERNHSSTVAARVLQLVEAVRIMAPEADWRWLRRIRSRLRWMSTPARDDRARLVPAATVVEFYDELARQADEGEGLSNRTRALMFRDAVLLAVFSRCGLRPKNIAAIAIGTSLQRRGGEWWLTFRADEMKNKRPYEVPLPGLTGILDRYIAHYRSILVQRSKAPVAGNALWLSDTGKPISAKQIGQLVSRRTNRDLGRDLNPRLLRKLIPTELSIHDPEHVGVAQPLLGHADYRTTERAYNRGQTIDAVRPYHGVLHALRATGAPTRAPGKAAGSEASTKQRSRPKFGTRNIFKRG